MRAKIKFVLNWMIIGEIHHTLLNLVNTIFKDLVQEAQRANECALFTLLTSFQSDSYSEFAIHVLSLPGLFSLPIFASLALRIRQEPSLATTSHPNLTYIVPFHEIQNFCSIYYYIYTSVCLLSFSLNRGSFRRAGITPILLTF